MERSATTVDRSSIFLDKTEDGKEPREGGRLGSREDVESQVRTQNLCYPSSRCVCAVVLQENGQTSNRIEEKQMMHKAELKFMQRKWSKQIALSITLPNVKI